MAAPYTEKMMLAATPDGSALGGNSYDELGLESLTFTRDPISQGAPPSGLVGYLVNGQVVLYWWGSAYATSYNVKRSTVSGGPYTTIATNITDPLVYYDNPPRGTYYYVVTVNATGTVSSSQVKVVANNQALWTYYSIGSERIELQDRQTFFDQIFNFCLHNIIVRKVLSNFCFWGPIRFVHWLEIDPVPS